MKQRTQVRDFYGRLLGTVEIDTVTGDKVIRDFYGKIRGYYNKRTNLTKDFYGKIVARGDQTGMLLPPWDQQRMRKK